MWKLLRVIRESGYISHQEALEIARQDKFYKEGTIERCLRADKYKSDEVRKWLFCIKIITSSAENGVHYVSGYEWIKDNEPVPISREEEEKDILTLAIQ